jgi:hypothetical protein
MQGKARLRAAMVADGSTEGASPLCCSFWESRLGAADFGWAWCGEVRPGSTMRGYSCRRQHGGRKPSLLLSLESGWGPTGRGAARHGGVRRGMVIVADGSTEPERALCCSFKRVDMVGCCTVGQGEAVRGNSCRQQQGGSRLSLLLSTEGRPGAACLGAACCGRVRQSPARCGYSCRRQHRGFRAPLLFSLESRLGRVRCG